MEILIANFSGAVRRETLHSREHLVAPLTMIVPGVLEGSKGPLLYPAEEIGKNPSMWNHVPILVDHPTRNGEHVSGREPSVLDRQAIGLILRTTVNNEKLVGEGWFDVARVMRLDNRILNALHSRQKIEISTGLFTDNERAEDGATFNGQPYDFIARNYRPDHLAILPDQTGACSIKDGCGVNNESSSSLIGFTGDTNGHIHSVSVDENGNGLAEDKDGHSHLIKDFQVRLNAGHVHALDRDSLADTGIKNNILPTASDLDAEEPSEDMLPEIVYERGCGPGEANLGSPSIDWQAIGHNRLRKQRGHKAEPQPGVLAEQSLKNDIILIPTIDWAAEAEARRQS